MPKPAPRADQRIAMGRGLVLRTRTRKTPANTLVPSNVVSHESHMGP
jgi:hypothetical protein